MKFLIRAVAAAAVALALGLCLPVPALAAEDYSYLGLDELAQGVPEEAREALDGQSIDQGLDVNGALGRIVDSAASALGEILRWALTSAGLVLAAAFLCSVASSLGTDGKTDYVNLVGVFVILSAAVGGVRTLMGEAARCIEELGDISTLMLPVLASASAAAGQAASGAAKYAASALFLNVLMTLGRKLIMPMIYMFLAASAGQAAFGGSAGGVAKLISRMIKHLLTAMAMAFTIYLVTTGLIASSADAAAVKVTKTAISTLLPVVGGMVSDAADAVVSGVSVIRGAVGAFGVVAVLAVCVLPFLRLAAGSAVYRAASALAETVTDKRLTGLIEAIGTAYSMALALAGTQAVMLLVSIIAGAKIAGA